MYRRHTFIEEGKVDSATPGNVNTDEGVTGNVGRGLVVNEAKG